MQNYESLVSDIKKLQNIALALSPKNGRRNWKNKWAVLASLAALAHHNCSVSLRVRRLTNTWVFDFDTGNPVYMHGAVAMQFTEDCRIMFFPKGPIANLGQCSLCDYSMLVAQLERACN